REIDVFEVAAERFREEADLLQGGAAIEAGGGADAKDGTWLQEFGAQRLTVTALLGDPAEAIAVACAVDRVAVGPGEYERSDGADCRIGESRQGRIRPAGLNLGVVIQHLDDVTPAGADAGIGGGGEAALSFQANDPYARETERDAAGTFLR